MLKAILTGLYVAYDQAPVVSGVEGVFAPGQATAIVGPNGSGKSTLLKAMAGLVAPQAGRVTLEGCGRGDLAYLPQDGGVDRDFPIEVGDFVSLGFMPRRGLFRAVGPAERDRLDHALAVVGLRELARRPIGALSGGQFQRALFARVMVQDARLILLDEPFTALDARAAEDLCGLVRAWTDEDRTVILVLHDLDHVRALCAQTLVMARQCVAWGPTPEVLTPDVLERARRMAAEPLQ